MDAAEVRQRILQHYGIRVDPQTSAYVLRKLEQAAGALREPAIPIMGGDARTGVPVRQMIDAAHLMS